MRTRSSQVPIFTRLCHELMLKGSYSTSSAGSAGRWASMWSSRVPLTQWICSTGQALSTTLAQSRTAASPFHAADGIGLAQHYGIPTRFLDWTFNALYAVYFAQVDNSPGTDNTDLSVWALDMNAITMMHHWEGGVGRNMMRSLVPRRRGNDFITAQDGLLLEIEHKWALGFFERNGDWPAVQDVVFAIHDEAETNPDNPEYYLYNQEHPMLRRIVLPAAEMPEICVKS